MDGLSDEFLARASFPVDQNNHFLGENPRTHCANRAQLVPHGGLRYRTAATPSGELAASADRRRVPRQTVVYDYRP